MKKNISIKIKAALLLVVFSLNTVIGFACAMGVDMGFNSLHHDTEETIETSIHIHADGNKHNPHDEVATHYNNSKEDSENDGCCNDGVMKFQSIDKNINTNTNSVISIPVLTTILTNIFGLDIFAQEQLSNQKNIAQFFYPPPDIRILIKSFQI